MAVPRSLYRVLSDRILRYLSANSSELAYHDIIYSISPTDPESLIVTYEYTASPDAHAIVYDLREVRHVIAGVSGRGWTCDDNLVSRIGASIGSTTWSRTNTSTSDPSTTFRLRLPKPIGGQPVLLPFDVPRMLPKSFALTGLPVPIRRSTMLVDGSHHGWTPLGIWTATGSYCGGSLWPERHMRTIVAGSRCEFMETQSWHAMTTPFHRHTVEQYLRKYEETFATTVPMGGKMRIAIAHVDDPVTWTHPSAQGAVVPIGTEELPVPTRPWSITADLAMRISFLIWGGACQLTGRNGSVIGSVLANALTVMFVWRADGAEAAQTIVRRAMRSFGRPSKRWVGSRRRAVMGGTTTLLQTPWDDLLAAVRTLTEMCWGEITSDEAAIAVLKAHGLLDKSEWLKS